MDMPTADELFMPGKGPATLNTATIERFKKQPLILIPRVTKKAMPTTFGEIRQAGSRGILVDQEGQAVYYASHVSPTFYQFVRTNRLFVKENYVKASPKMNFPVRSLELKSSWLIVPNKDKNEMSKRFFTTKARIPLLICRDGGNNCTGEEVVIDWRQTKEVIVALVGLHVVGVVEDHPEFIWSTFEHKDNAPDLPEGMDPDSPRPVSNKSWTFYKANTPANECNQLNARTIALNAKLNQLSPITQVFRQFAFGSGVDGDRKNIESLNESVHKQLAAGSIWQNYFLVGGVWFMRSNGLEPGLSGPKIQRLTTGSIHLSNTTMETFTQSKKQNCFSCHDTSAKPEHKLPPMNMNLSHILINGLIQRDQAARARTKTIRPKDAPAIKSYAEVRNLLDNFVKQNKVPIELAQHGAFWKKMSYKEFTQGNIPGVVDPSTGNPLKVLIVKNSEKSNLIMALRGTPGSIFDPVDGTIGRMPPTGPFMSEDDIKALADWIDRGCPNEP